MITKHLSQLLLGAMLVWGYQSAHAESTSVHYAQNESGYYNQYKSRNSSHDEANNNRQTANDTVNIPTVSSKDKRKSVFSNQQEQPFVPHPDYYNYQYMNPTTNSFQ